MVMMMIRSLEKRRDDDQRRIDDLCSGESKGRRREKVETCGESLEFVRWDEEKGCCERGVHRELTKLQSSVVSELVGGLCSKT